MESMENQKEEQKDTQISTQGNNYVTIIPVEYTRNRMFNNNNQNQECLVEHYRTHEEFTQNEELNNSQGALYSVSQRVPPVNTSYSSLGPESNFNNSDQVGQYKSLTPDWESSKAESSNTDMTKDNTPDSEKQTTESTNSSGTSSVTTSTAPVTSSCEPLLGPVIPMMVYLHSRVAISMEIEDTPSASAEVICQAIINSDELGLNKQLASQVFTLWMTSPILEVQLKPTHKPYEVRRAWRTLVEQYSHGSFNKQQRDEPIVSFQRNVFFPQHLEEKIKDQKILELLYEEARDNILQGRYPCEPAHYIMLGGIQARVELGPYNPQTHSTHYFREEQSKYLPIHIRKSSTWTWLPISSKNSAEVRLLEQFKRIPTSATNRKLMRKYLEFCWSLPFYGAAFFEGQVEQPVRGLMSLMTHQDIPVLVGINSKGVYVIDDVQCTLLLGLRYEDLSWDYARPSREDDPNCLPCIFLQFMIVENGARVSKILQVFSRQASLMDTLITGFVHQLKGKANDEGDRAFEHQANGEGDTHAPITNAVHVAPLLPSLSNKLSRLTLATFDENGHCIGQMGSWSFSY